MSDKVIMNNQVTVKKRDNDDIMDGFEIMLDELQQSVIEKIKNSNIQIDKDRLNY